LFDHLLVGTLAHCGRARAAQIIATIPEGAIIAPYDRILDAIQSAYEQVPEGPLTAQAVCAFLPQGRVAVLAAEAWTDAAGDPSRWAVRVKRRWARARIAAAADRISTAAGNGDVDDPELAELIAREIETMREVWGA
jgi:hypothetical protein